MQPRLAEDGPELLLPPYPTTLDSQRAKGAHKGTLTHAETSRNETKDWNVGKNKKRSTWIGIF